MRQSPARCALTLLPLRAALALVFTLSLATALATSTLAGSRGGQVGIEIVAGSHPRGDGELDEVRFLCRDDDSNVDVTLPMSWIRFVVHHLDGELAVEGESIDLKLLWETIEELGPEEELRIQDQEAKIRIWLE
jgi:hypothetical protein